GSGGRAAGAGRECRGGAAAGVVARAAAGPVRAADPLRPPCGAPRAVLRKGRERRGQMTRMFGRVSPGCLALLGALVPVATVGPASPQYRVAHEVSLPGDDGWDYLTFEPAGHRLFIAHGTR